MTKQEVQEETEKLYEWGITFFEMGFDACLSLIAKTGNFAKISKVDAIRRFIAEQTKEK